MCAVCVWRADCEESLCVWRGRELMRGVVKWCRLRSVILCVLVRVCRAVCSLSQALEIAIYSDVRYYSYDEQQYISTY